MCASAAIDEARFLAAFLRELDHAAQLTGPRTGAKHLLRRRHALFDGARDRRRDPRPHRRSYGRSRPDAEITLEANPGSVEAGRFRGYAACRRQSRLARRAVAQR